MIKISRNYEGDVCVVDSSNDGDDIDAYRDKLIIIIITTGVMKITMMTEVVAVMIRWTEVKLFSENV